jgi:hypothetical protein
MSLPDFASCSNSSCICSFRFASCHVPASWRTAATCCLMAPIGQWGITSTVFASSQAAAGCDTSASVCRLIASVILPDFAAKKTICSDGYACDDVFTASMKQFASRTTFINGELPARHLFCDFLNQFRQQLPLHFPCSLRRCHQRFGNYEPGKLSPARSARSFNILRK